MSPRPSSTVLGTEPGAPKGPKMGPAVQTLTLARATPGPSAAAPPSTVTLAKRHTARVGFTRQGFPDPPNAWALHPKAQRTDAVHTGGT